LASHQSKSVEDHQSGAPSSTLVELDEQTGRSSKKRKGHRKRRHGHQHSGRDGKSEEHQGRAPAENERVQTRDSDLMAAAIQQVTAQTSPEAQE